MGSRAVQRLDERAELQLANELHHFLATAGERETTADRRSAALIRAHEAGWILLSSAVGTGFAAVAQAIRLGLGEIARAVREHS